MSVKSRWEQYKEKIGDVRPWDILDPHKHVKSEEISDARYKICLECPELIDLTKQCKQCGCFMPLKTKLEAAFCPLKKW